MDIAAFAKQDVGLIVGAALLFVGIASNVIVKSVIIPKLRKSDSPDAAQQIKVLSIVGMFDFLLFSIAGSALILLHFN